MDDVRCGTCWDVIDYEIPYVEHLTEPHVLLLKHLALVKFYESGLCIPCQQVRQPLGAEPRNQSLFLRRCSRLHLAKSAVLGGCSYC